MKNLLSGANVATRAILLNEIARNYWNSSLDSSIKYSTEALEVAISKELPIEMARSLNLMGAAFDTRGEYGKALSYYSQIVKMGKRMSIYVPSKSLDILLNNQNEEQTDAMVLDDATFSNGNIGLGSQADREMFLSIMGRGLSNLGVLYARLSLYSKSMICFKEAYDVMSRMDDMIGAASTLTNIGSLYIKMENPESGQQSFREAIAIIQNASSDPIILAEFRMSMAELQIATGQHDSAQVALLESNRVFQSHGNLKGQSVVNTLLGKLYFKEEKYQKSIESLSEALKVHLQMNDSEGEGLTYILLGDAYRQLGKFEEAEAHFMKAMNLGRSLVYRSIEADALLGLSSLREKQNKPLEALKFYKEYTVVARWLFEQKGNTDLLNQQALFEFERMENENDHFKKENQLKSESLKRQQALRAVSLAFLLVFLLFGMVLLFLYRNLLKANGRLQQMNVELEEKVLERTNELRDSLKLAREGERLKSTFLANLSHEIRTPLNGIIGFTTLLEHSFDLGANESKYIEEIKLSSDRLMGFLNDLIDLSQTESNQFEIKQIHCDLLAMGNRLVERFGREVEKKGLTLHTNFNQVPNVITDCENLQRILTIVLSNAVKYTDKGSISFGLGYKELDSSVSFTITDTGIGIDPDFLPTIFESFLQGGDKLSRLHQGAGLGLSLAKRLVGLLNGTIDINSRKGAGTIVVIKIPVALAPGTSARVKYERDVAAKRPDTMGPKPKKAKALIVEENTYTRFYLQSLLKKHFNVYVARDGNEALSLIDDSSNKNYLFDLVIAHTGMKEPWNLTGFINEVYSRRPGYLKRTIAVRWDTKDDRALFDNLENVYWIQGALDKEKILEVLFQNQMKRLQNG